jgi:hypothetical protein
LLGCRQQEVRPCNGQNSLVLGNRKIDLRQIKG